MTGSEKTMEPAFCRRCHDGFHDGVLLRSAADDEYQLFFVHEVDAHELGCTLHAGAFGVDDGRRRASAARAASMIEPV